MTTHTLSPATLPLWRDVATLLDLFVRAFGAAAELLARRTLHAYDARSAARWLADIEATVRRLLFAEAALLKLKPSVARKGVAPPPKKEAPTTYNPNAYREMMLGQPGLIRIGAHLPRLNDAANWKVSFKLGAEQCPAAREFIAPPPPATSPRDPWPAKKQVSVEKIARRLEAVRRVIADPGPWVRRLARKLQRQPQLALKLSKLPQRRWRTPCSAVLPASLDVAVELRRRE